MVIKEAQRYLGIRFWALIQPIGSVPAFAIYVYTGYNPDLGIHYFAAYKNPRQVIGCNYKSLQNGRRIRPFCIDFQRVEEAIKDAAIPVCV